MATPHVAGAAALYLEANPTASPAVVQSALKSNGTANTITSIPSGTVNLLLYSLVTVGPPPPAPAAPALISPGDASTGISTSPTLSWQTSSGADSYGVQVSTDPGFSTIVYSQTGIVSTSTTVSPPLSGSTVYYWRVNATNISGTSAWSGSYSFTTTAGSPPSAPALSSPLNGSSNISKNPTLIWNASGGATSYRVQVSTDAGFATIVFDQITSSTSITVSPTLGSRVTYYWRVYAPNTYGTSTSSDVWSFRTRK